MNRRGFLRRAAGWGVAASVAPAVVPDVYFVGHLELVKLLGPLARTTNLQKDPFRHGYNCSREEVNGIRALAFFNPSGYLTARQWGDNGEPVAALINVGDPDPPVLP